MVEFDSGPAIVVTHQAAECCIQRRLANRATLGEVELGPFRRCCTSRESSIVEDESFASR
jgi:hypothetical protein